LDTTQTQELKELLSGGGVRHGYVTDFSFFHSGELGIERRSGEVPGLRRIEAKGYIAGERTALSSTRSEGERNGQNKKCPAKPGGGGEGWEILPRRSQKWLTPAQTEEESIRRKAQCISLGTDLTIWESTKRGTNKKPSNGKGLISVRRKKTNENQKSYFGYEDDPA